MMYSPPLPLPCPPDAPKLCATLVAPTRLPALWRRTLNRTAVQGFAFTMPAGTVTISLPGGCAAGSADTGNGTAPCVHCAAGRHAAANATACEACVPGQFDHGEPKPPPHLSTRPPHDPSLKAMHSGPLNAAALQRTDSDPATACELCPAGYGSSAGQIECRPEHCIRGLTVSADPPLPLLAALVRCVHRCRLLAFGQPGFRSESSERGGGGGEQVAFGTTMCSGYRTGQVCPVDCEQG